LGWGPIKCPHPIARKEKVDVDPVGRTEALEGWEEVKRRLIPPQLPPLYGEQIGLSTKISHRAFALLMRG
jgi:hypothetical protein